MTTRITSFWWRLEFCGYHILFLFKHIFSLSKTLKSYLYVARGYWPLDSDVKNWWCCLCLTVSTKCYLGRCWTNHTVHQYAIINLLSCILSPFSVLLESGHLAPWAMDYQKSWQKIGFQSLSIKCKVWTLSFASHKKYWRSSDTSDVHMYLDMG